MHTWTHSSTPYRILKDPFLPRGQDCKTFSFHCPKETPSFWRQRWLAFSFISATLVLCYLSNPSFAWSPLGFVWTPLRTFPPWMPLSLSHPHPPTFHPLLYSSWGLVSQQVFLPALHPLDSCTWRSDRVQWWWHQPTVTEHTEWSHYSLWLPSSTCALPCSQEWVLLPLGALRKAGSHTKS